MSVSLIFLVLNIAIVPHEYSTLHIGKSFPLYIAILSVLLLLMVILYIAFYLIATGVLKKAELTERIQFFEMQERQYKLQKEYIKETSKQRHDFRQSIFTLKQLADENDLTSLKNYLSDYVNALPKTEIVQYCSNNALNALLNYYAHSAAEHGIELQWNIELPDTITVSEPDLCSLFGNLIENAFAGCNTLEEGKRYHCLSVTVRNNINLYIVSTNNFDGFVKIKNNRYISTKRTGGGIGIRSVNMICEKYNGNAHFHHKGNEFYADVMLTLV
jgi:sensor histidine kinase regulating citrate/malate metabolism